MRSPWVVLRRVSDIPYVRLASLLIAIAIVFAVLMIVSLPSGYAAGDFEHDAALYQDWLEAALLLQHAQASIAADSDRSSARALLPHLLVPTQMSVFDAMADLPEEHGFFAAEDFALPRFVDPPPRRPIIALTFDDGPGPLTPYILDIFDEHGGYATFCVLGRAIAGREETIMRMWQSGHDIVGHSWNHTAFTRLSRSQVQDQVQRTSAAIEAITGEAPPRLVRTPYGSENAQVRAAVAELGYSTLFWSLDPQDWQVRNARAILQHISDTATDGAIVLLHDIHTTTVDAMRLVVPYLIERGFSLVTVSEVVERFYPDLAPGQRVVGRR